MGDNKSHIGIYLNLDRPDDREIHRILQNIPSYVSKASYIKQAIAFFDKNCGNNNEIYVTQNLLEKTRTAGPKKTQEENPKPEQTPEEKRKEKKVAQEKTKDREPKKKVRKEEPMVKDIPDLDRDRREEEALKELQEPVEGNNLIVKNDSDIDDTVDYMGVVEGFFN